MRCATGLTRLKLVVAICAFAFALTVAGGALAGDGDVLSHQKISDTEGNFDGVLVDNIAFGWSVTAIGDLNDDGVTDLAVGVPTDDDGGSSRGAVWVLIMDSSANGMVASYKKISDTQPGNFNGVLDDDDYFGQAVMGLGDLDNDGVADLAVGAPGDDDGGAHRGAVWILFLNSNGTVKSHEKISDAAPEFNGVLSDNTWFGGALAEIGDLNDDGVVDLAVGARYDNDGGSNRGAVWILFLNSLGKIAASPGVPGYQKISDTEGLFTGVLDDGDRFGQSVASITEVSDGEMWLAVGAPRDDDGGTDRGAVWLLTVNNLGNVVQHQKISDTEGGFTHVFNDGDRFGNAVAALGDLDADGTPEMAVGDWNDDDGGINRGAVWELFLASDGKVAYHKKISDIVGNFDGVLDDGDQFGYSLADLGRFNAGAVSDLVVGAPGDDDGGPCCNSNRGAVWILFLDGQDASCVDTSPGANWVGGTGNFSDVANWDPAGLPWTDWKTFFDDDPVSSAYTVGFTGGAYTSAKPEIHSNDITFDLSGGGIYTLDEICGDALVLGGGIKDTGLTISGGRVDATTGAVNLINLLSTTQTELSLTGGGELFCERLTLGYTDASITSDGWVVVSVRDGTLEAVQLNIGGGATDVAIVEVSGPYSVLTVDGFGLFLPGFDGSITGTPSLKLGVYNGGQVNVPSGVLWAGYGAPAGASAGVDVANWGSQLTAQTIRTGGGDGPGHLVVRDEAVCHVTDELLVGSLGPTGFDGLRISTGGQVTCAKAQLGRYAGEAAAVLVEDVGSKWTVTGELKIGEEDQAEVYLESDTEASWGDTHVGEHGFIGVSGDLTAEALNVERNAGLTGLGVSIQNGTVTLTRTGTLPEESGLKVAGSLLSTVGVSGSGILDVDGGTLIGTSTNHIAGTGKIAVSSGGNAFLAKGMNELFLGHSPASVGSLTVDGPSSEVIASLAGVGHEGTGVIELTNGGELLSLQAVLGHDPGSSGVVKLTGNSLWTVSGQVLVGLYGYGKLEVQNPAKVDAGSILAATNGLVVGSTTIWVTGTPPPAPPPSSSAASTSTTGGIYTDTLTVLSGATIDVDGVELQPGGVLIGDGELTLPVVNTGTLCPGDAPEAICEFTINGDYQQSASGKLCIDLGQPGGGFPFPLPPESDHVTVSGTATLNGTLEVRLKDGVSISGSAENEIMTATSITGTFPTVITSPGLAVMVNVTGNTVTLTAMEGPVAVLITDFVATPLGNGIELSWSLFADEGIEGFEIYRSDGDDPAERVLNPQLIDSSERAFTDETALPGVRYRYALGVIAETGMFRSRPAEAEIAPLALRLFQNHPNPFNPVTTIGYEVPEASYVTLRVYSAAGQLVRKLVDREVSAGRQEITWDGTNNAGAGVASGVYYYRLTVGKETLTKKMALLK